MAIKKFKVMASNAKKPDGKCIPKSMRKSVESACGKKKAVKASDSECKYRIDIFKKDNPDALVKREFKMFKSEDEAKKYGESIANGNIVNVMKVNVGCTKKSVKSVRILFPWEVEGEFADGYRYTAKGDSEAECVEKLGDMQDKHGELVWYSGTTDEYYDAGRLIDSACTKKSVKSSKGLTVPKSKRKSVKASSGLFDDFIFLRLGRGRYGVTYKSTGADYEVGTENGSWWIERGAPSKSFSSKLQMLQYLRQISEETKARDEAQYDSAKWGVFLDGETEPFAVFDDKSEARRALNKQMAIKDVDGYVDEVKSSKSVKKFGIKASKAAKKRKAIKASGITDDIVIYFNGDNVYQGSIYDMADAIENLCYDDEVNAKFQEWCNQFGDPFDFDGSPIDTAAVFTDIIIHEAEEAPISEDGKSEFYVDGNGILDFEILYADDIYGAKSIKCWDNGNDVWEYQESYDNYYDEEPPEHIGKELERLAKLTDKYMNMWFDKFEELHPNERYSNVYDFPDVDEAVGFTRDAAEYYPDQIEIGASKSIKCNDGIAPDDYDSVEDLVPEAYALSGGEDDDMLEYVEDYIATEGCPATVNFVTYNTPNDWSVDVSKYGENVVSDFIWYLEEVAPELSDKFYDYPSYEDDTTRNAFKGTKYEEGGKYTTFYGDNALAANDYEFQFYPAQNQWSAPQIEFDTDELKLIGFTDDEIDELMRIYEDYKVAWVENCKYINAHISEFLANLESNVNASTNIKAGLSLNLNAKPNYTDWMLRGYKFDGEDVTTLRIDFQDDVKQAVMDMFADPDIETVDLYKIPTEQETTGVFEDEEYFATFTRDDINSSVDIEAGITVGEDSRFDFSNPIYELDDYVKSLADGTVNQVQGITYDISKETIAFFDEDNNVVFVQPIGGIIPEPDDLETDINELSAAIRSEMGNAYGRDNWEQDNDDPDYASRAVELSEDIGEVDIDDLEPITGDDVDYGYGYDSNGDAIDESTVEELYRIAEYEILPKSELAKIDEYVSIDEDSWDFYMSSPHVTEKFYIHFKLTEKDINFNDYTLPDGKMFLDFNYYTAVLDFDIYVENGEITSVILEDKKIYRPDGAFDDYDVKQFDDLYNVDALINYVEHIAADTVMDIYNGTTNL